MPNYLQECFQQFTLHRQYESTLIWSSPALDTVKLHDFYKYSGYKVIFYIKRQNNMGESQKHAKWKTWNTKDWILYDSIWMKLQKFQNYSDKKQISSGLRIREGITCKKSMKKLLGVVEMLYIWVVVDVTWMNTIHQMAPLKWVNSIVCKLYLY